MSKEKGKPVNTNRWMSQFMKDEKNLMASMVKEKVRVVTSSPSLNWALSGGFVFGETTVLYGPEGGGKSLTSMIAVGSMMQSDSEALAVLISTEMRAPSPEKLIQLGIDPDRLVIRQVNTIHDVFDWITSKDEKFSNSDGSKGGPGLQFMLLEGAPVKAIIIDSIKGIQGPKEQNLETVEKDFMGDISKVLNPALRSILPVIRLYNLMTLLIQQVNMNMNPDEVKYQNKKYIIPSGMALRHFAEKIALVERVESKDSKLFNENIQSIRELPIQVGHTIRVKVEKANLDTPFREAEFQVDYNKGVVNTASEVVNLATNLGVISHPLNPQGAPIVSQWVFKDQLGNELKFIGMPKLLEAVEAAPELQRHIMSLIHALDAK